MGPGDSLGSVTPPDPAAAPAGKNLLINGQFFHWQRGTSQTSSGYGSDDRWANANVGSTKTHSQQAFAFGQTEVPGNPRFFSRTVVASVAGVGNYVFKRQWLEFLWMFAGRKVALSFYAKANANKDLAVEFGYDYGSGGSPAGAGLAVEKVALTDQWQRHVVLADLPSIAGKTVGDNSALQLTFWMDAGSSFDARTDSLGQQSGTFDIAQVQLEFGEEATDFEYRFWGEELALCQRFYQLHLFNYTLNWGSGGGGFGVTYPLPVALRTSSPGITSSFTYSNASGGVVAMQGGGTVSARVAANGTAFGQISFSGNFALNAELGV
jgi:hypothetical protein